MRQKIIIMLFLLVNSFTAFAQSGSKVVKVYGVDFTGVKVYAADETVNEFVNAFEGINMLFVSEPNKYNFSKVVESETVLKIKMILEVNKSFDFSNIKTLDKEIAPIDFAQKIRNYKLEEKEGTGLIVFAKLLDKSTKKGTFDVVLFDIATREVISSQEFVGKAGGFGLRNFWAGSVSSLIKKCRLVNK